MKWVRKRLIPIAIIVSILLAIGVPFIINESYKVENGYLTVWNGADILSYYGAILSALGTIILGIVAWKQNARLLKVEESTYLAANAGSALLTEITITGVQSQACNFENHSEQIVLTEEAKQSQSPLDYGSISFLCRIEPFDLTKHIALVNVKNVLLIGAKNLQQNADAILTGKGEDSRYSRVAMLKEHDEFQFTLIMSKTEKQHFITAINGMYNEIFMDIDVSLMTDRYVSSDLRCRATLRSADYDEKEKIYSHFKTDAYDPPKCFWGGSQVHNQSSVSIKTIRTEEKING